LARVLEIHDYALDRQTLEGFQLLKAAHQHRQVRLGARLLFSQNAAHRCSQQPVQHRRHLSCGAGNRRRGRGFSGEAFSQLIHQLAPQLVELGHRQKQLALKGNLQPVQLPGGAAKTSELLPQPLWIKATTAGWFQRLLRTHAGRTAQHFKQQRLTCPARHLEREGAPLLSHLLLR